MRINKNDKHLRQKQRTMIMMMKHILFNSCGKYQPHRTTYARQKQMKREKKGVKSRLTVLIKTQKHK